MKSIYVGNLSYSATEDMLRSLFAKYGTVERVNIVTDRDTWIMHTPKLLVAVEAMRLIG